jgi:hypothetical protein
LLAGMLIRVHGYRCLPGSWEIGGDAGLMIWKIRFFTNNAMDPSMYVKYEEIMKTTDTQLTKDRIEWSARNSRNEETKFKDDMHAKV